MSRTPPTLNTKAIRAGVQHIIARAALTTTTLAAAALTPQGISAVNPRLGEKILFTMGNSLPNLPLNHAIREIIRGKRARPSWPQTFMAADLHGRRPSWPQT
jgi:hypothetical protein